MSDYSARLGEGYAAYQAAVGDLFSKAREATAEAQQRYSAELFASTGGDDAPARMSTAWLRYQQDLANLAYEHWRGMWEQQRDLATTVDEVQTESAAAAYEQYIAQLRAAAGDSAKAVDAPAKTSSAASGQRRPRRRTTGS